MAKDNGNNGGNAVMERDGVQATVPVAITLEMIMGKIEELGAKLDEHIKKFENVGAGAGRGSRQSQREMTDDDARKVLGELATKKHNEAADELGLSYGQVYSARLGYTFKHIRKELSEAGVKNQWLDTTHNG
jgi:hypothetical protein